MNVIYKVLQERFKHAEGLNRPLPSSPSQTVLGALTPRTISHEPIFQKIEMSSQNKSINVKAPKHIEDIPFRRQDRRILYARKRRIVDRKLIIILNVIGLFILVLGLVVLGLFFALHQDYKRIKIFIILGPVLAAAGFVVMMFSIEVCVRLVRSIKREKDPEIDDIDDVHHIKHWVHPELIPFGWGHRDSLFESTFIDEETIGLEREIPEDMESKEIPADVYDEDSSRYKEVDRPQLAVLSPSPEIQTQVSLEEGTSSLPKGNI